MEKNVQPDRLQVKIMRRMRFACRITKTITYPQNM